MDGGVKIELGKIVDRLAATYKPERIVLFGSHAEGDPHPDSDIDLLIVKDTDTPYYDRISEVRRQLSDVLGRHPFDPIVLTPHEVAEQVRARRSFITHILREGKALYGG